MKDQFGGPDRDVQPDWESSAGTNRGNNRNGKLSANGSADKALADAQTALKDAETKAAAAKEAWGRTLDFFKKNLKG